ncbi:MAG TPA: phosphodiesterase [Ilumatobacter sp.]|nr:phosphodiesterase [Ilumatobacter sp.]
MLIAQITDCHVVEPGELVADRVDSGEALERAVRQINGLPTPPALVVATGDLVNDGRPEQYDRFQAIVAELTVPLIPVPGNHDDRDELRARYPTLLPAGEADQPIDHVLDLGPLRLVFVDTQVPGSVAGAITPAQVGWLDEVLSDAPDRPTVVFQHHPPFATGIGFMDREAFTGARGYGTMLAHHPQVELVSCGHLHRSIIRRFGGTVACTWPSTSAQLELGLGDAPIRYTDEPAAFALHVHDDAHGVRSHLQTIGDIARWTPSWAIDPV